MDLRLTREASGDGSRRRTRWWLLALIAVVVLVPAAAAAYLVNRVPAEPVSLPSAVTADGTEVDLGTMGGTYGEAKDINADGVVVGYASTADGVTHAFLSRNGTMIDLGLSRYAAALNDAGQVLVALMDPNASGPHPFLWTDGVVQALNSDLGPLYSAADIDEEGRIAGAVKATPRLYPVPPDGTMLLIGALWENGRVTLLETADAMIVDPYRIGENGAVLGLGCVNGRYYPNHLLLWRAGGITDLGAGQPIAMNDRGQVVLQNEWGCYLWDAGVSTPLNGADGTTLRACDINGSGVVAGAVEDQDGTQQAAIWQDGRITLLDLHSKNSSASAINDAGTVVGSRQK
jgi:probable HAF family extracellular repeat protein